MNQEYCENKTCASTQFLQTQKNQLFEQQEQLERYCIVLHRFDFKSTKYDLNLNKAYLLPILINEGDNEPTVIKRANQFLSFKFSEIELSYIWNFLGGITSLD